MSTDFQYLKEKVNQINSQNQTSQEWFKQVSKKAKAQADLNSLQNQISNFAKTEADFKKDYDNFAYNWNNSDAANDILIKTRNYYAEAEWISEQLKKYGDSYKKQFGEENYNTLYDTIDNTVKNKGAVLKDFQNKTKLYSNYKSADEYNKMAKNADYAQKYKGYSYQQIKDLLESDGYTTKRRRGLIDESEAEWLKNQRYALATSAEIQQEIEALGGEEKWLSQKRNAENQRVMSEGEKRHAIKSGTYNSILENSSKLQKEAQANLDQIALLKTILAQKKKQEEFDKNWGSITVDDNYSPKINKEETDRYYRTVNSIPAKDFKDELDDKYLIAPDLKAQLQRLALMEKPERDKYNLIYEEQGIEKANEYADDLVSNVLDARLNQNEMEEFYKFSSQNALTSVLGSLASVPLSLGSGIEYVGNVLSGQTDKRILSATRAQGLREGAKSQIDSEFWDFVYDTVMSGVDSIAAAGISAMAPYLGEVLLGGSAAASTFNDALDRGVTGGDAILSSIAAGTAESLFEHLSIGKLFDIKDLTGGFTKAGIKQAAKKIGTDILVNASEETLTEIANIVTDQLINTDLSSYAIAVKDYYMQGMSPEEAKKKAAEDVGNQVLTAMASGALMGFVFGSIGSGAGTISSQIKNSKNGNAIISNQSLDSFKTLAADSGISDIVKDAEKLTEKSKPSQIGAVFNRLVQAKTNEAVKSMETALLENGATKSGSNSAKGWATQIIKTALSPKNGKVAMQDMMLRTNKVTSEVYTDFADNGKYGGDTLLALNELVTSPKTQTATEGNSVNATGGQTVVNEQGVEVPVTADGQPAAGPVATGGIKGIASAPRTGAIRPITEAYGRSVAENLERQSRTPQRPKIKKITKTGEAIVKAIGKAMGVEVEFTDSAVDGVADGKTVDHKKVYISRYTVDPIKEVIKHEFTHTTEISKHYGKFQKYLFEESEAFKTWLESKGYTRWSQMETDIIDLYKQNGEKLDHEGAKTEIVAKFVSENLFMDKGTEVTESFLNELYLKDRNLFDRFVDWVKSVFARLKANGAVNKDIIKLEQKFIRLAETAKKQRVKDEAKQGNNTSGKSQYLFAGENAKTADKLKLSTAKQMLKDGVDSEKYRTEAVTQFAQNPDADVRYSLPDNKYANYNKPITIEDIQTLRSIGRKSINNFTSADIEKAQKWAYKFYQQLGEKSPFFRAWFGDWRAYDIKNKIPVINKSTAKTFKAGKAENADTGRYISWGDQIKGETKIKYGTESDVYGFLENIEEIVKNSILLDTNVSVLSSKHKMDNTEFMHSMYSIIEDKDGNECLIKLLVEEAFNDKMTAEFSRAYELQEIKKVATLHTGVHSNNGGLTRQVTTNYSISELFEFVKQYDKSFSPKPVVEHLLNKDGTPKKFYHQTENTFTKFDIRHKGAGTSDLETPFGIFLKESDRDIGLKGKIQMQLYARMVNPLVVKNRTELVKKISEFSAEYAEIYNKSKEIDKEYSKKHEDAIKAFNDFIIQNSQSPNRKSRQELYEDPEFIKLFEAEDNIVDEWQEINRENDLKAKEALTKTLRDNGFDGVILENDVGSFGRSTEAYIVLDNTQVKSAEKGTPNANIGTFDSTEGDIRYSIPDIARGKTAPELWEMSQKGEITSDDALKVLADEYGTMPKGENPKVDVTVPQKVSEKQGVRRFARTALESGHLTEGMSENAKREMIDGVLNYRIVSDREAVRAAEKKIENDIEAAIKEWESVVNSGKIPTKKDIALAEALMVEAAKDGHENDVALYLTEIAALGTQMGQSIQALSLLKKLSGVGQVQYISRVIAQLNADLERRYGSKYVNKIKLDPSFENILRNSKNPSEIEEIVDDILTDVARQMPSTWLDKFNAWRYLAMLGNTRTHIRNFLGNAVFLPAIRIKDAAAAIAERIFIKDVSNRTKVFKVSKDYREFAKADFENVKELITSSGKMNPSDKVQDRRKIFTSKAFAWLEKARKINFDLLEKEDLIFLRSHYVHALGSVLQARGLDINNLTETELTEIRDIAINEAQKATYRDFSFFADWLNKAAHPTKKGTPIDVVTKGFGVLVEGAFPFKKTPINILKRGIEYSPIGIATSLGNAVLAARRGEYSGAELIDGLAAGMTGTMILGFGILLQSLGWITGGLGYDDEDALERLAGAQPYAIDFGDWSYTIDWMAPASLPLLIGAELSKASKKGEGLNILDALTTIAEPMTELSFLQGVNDIIEGVAYSGEDGLGVTGEIVTNLASSYISQYFPTLAGQVARTFDSTRRTNFIDKNVPIPKSIQKTHQKILGKIPGAENKKVPYIDAWGRTEENDNILLRAFENFVSPGYVSTVKDDAVNDELAKIFVDTGESGIIPKRAKTSFEVSGETVNLNADEYVQYATDKGRYSRQYLEEVMSNPLYQGLPSESKAAVISNLYSFANAKAKSNVSDYDYTTNDYYKTAAKLETAGFSPVSYYIAKVAMSEENADKNGDGSVSKSEKKSALRKAGFNSKDINTILNINK